MTTKRDQFMEWLRRNPKHQCLDDELADAAARIWEQWQPIETAPKDWSQVILYYQDSGLDDDVMAGYYSCEDGGKDCWMDNYGDELKPTHWMPLPKPPTEEKSQ